MRIRKVAIADPTHRLIPSRFPPIGAFDDVATPEDLQAVMELEGWTNDRLVAERLARLPRAEWVYGRPNASVVMASFLHTPPSGLRFSSGALGAWYGAMRVETAIAEVGHHLRREMVRSRMERFTATYRAYGARIAGRHLDIRVARRVGAAALCLVGLFGRRRPSARRRARPATTASSMRAFKV